MTWATSTYICGRKQGDAWVDFILCSVHGESLDDWHLLWQSRSWFCDFRSGAHDSQYNKGIFVGSRRCFCHVLLTGVVSGVTWTNVGVTRRRFNGHCASCSTKHSTISDLCYLIVCEEDIIDKKQISDNIIAVWCGELSHCGSRHV